MLNTSIAPIEHFLAVLHLSRSFSKASFLHRQYMTLRFLLQAQVNSAPIAPANPTFGEVGTSARAFKTGDECNELGA